ncbi:hypothetical protein D3C86_2104680 [compost metagenome]
MRLPFTIEGKHDRIEIEKVLDIEAKLLQKQVQIAHTAIKGTRNRIDQANHAFESRTVFACAFIPFAEPR